MKLRSLVIATCLAVVTATASHAKIVGAVGATINSSGPGFGSIADTHNQNGLFDNYVSGATRFNPFVATTTHTLSFTGNEWFSNDPSTAASVTYDLGSILKINKMALWNEEVSGIGLLDLSVSSDGVSFSSLLTGLTPTDNPTGSDYLADVYDFAPTMFQYIRMDMSRCPQAPSTFDACAIGEVAFNVAPVPLPAGLPLLLTSLGAIGFLRRRK